MAQSVSREVRSSIILRASQAEIELLRIPAGRFNMGSPNENFSEAPVHPVTIVRPFSLGRFPITQRQWVSICGENPSEFRDAPDNPVDSVSWTEAVRFCTLVAAETNCAVRLPSEAEWEYACRAGSTGEFHFSAEGPFADELSVRNRVRQELEDFAWFENNSLEATRPVGQKHANSWGLHDMLGNVWEWCSDHWHDGYEGAPAGGAPWLDVADAKPRRCLRGGAWDMNAFRCRSCYRSWDWEHLAKNRIGFRICMD